MCDVLKAEKTETLVLYQPQNTEPSEVKDNRKKLVDSRQRPSDIRTISNVLRPPLPEVGCTLEHANNHVLSFSMRILVVF